MGRSGDRVFVDAPGRHEDAADDVGLAATGGGDDRHQIDLLEGAEIRRAGAHRIGIVEQDADDTVKTRAISGLNSLPNNAGVEPLLKIARSSKNMAVTKAAVSALSNSRDPRAISYMEELVKR